MYAFFIVCVVLLSSFRAFAQRKPPLPGNLKQDSSVAEILSWLDQSSFRNAGIILKNSWDPDTAIPPWVHGRRSTHTLVFARGFRVTNIDGCNLILRNDNAKIIIDSKLADSTHPLITDVWVQLNRMSPNKGPRTHRYTNDRQTVSLPGPWRTEFKYRGFFSRTMVGLTLHSAEWKEPKHWEGRNLAFTFDTREMSENFDAAFRQAIKLCQSK